MEGFIPGGRATLMLDVVAVAMILIVPVLWWSIYALAKCHRYATHAKVQLVMAAVLLLAVILFEVEIRSVGWRDRAAPSPYLGPVLYTVLIVHILIATATVLSWVATVFFALKRFPWPPKPGAHSILHKKLGKFAAIGMTLTAITGWIFYWMAFFAT